MFVLTFGPGDLLWEKWGHNAIWIHDESVSRKYRDRDLIYNWGTFPEFNNSFYWKFIQGRLWYELRTSPHPADWVVHPDRKPKRLSSEAEPDIETEKGSANRVAAPDTDANRAYFYNYYTNNCSTKVRDAIDNVTDGAIAKATKGVLTDQTFRFHADRIYIDNLGLYIGLQGVLGHPVDRRITRWEEMFLPMEMHKELAKVKVVIDGKEQWLVNRDPDDPVTREIIAEIREQVPGLPSMACRIRNAGCYFR